MQIIRKMQEENVVPFIETDDKFNSLLVRVTKAEIDVMAGELASQRGYPRALGRLVIEKN
jgi:hypothetical protein